MSHAPLLSADTPGKYSLCGVVLALLATTIGCRGRGKPTGEQVTAAIARQAIEQPRQPSDDPADPFRLGAAAPEGEGAAGDPGVIAFVDGRPVSRDRVVNLLLAGHGTGVLEQIVVLECARQMAAEQGIVVGPRNTEAEYDRALRALMSPLVSADETAPYDREEAERILNAVLSRRNVSRAEFEAGLKRNAYLRAIVRANMKFTDAQIEEEFERAFGRRADIRHIQLASLMEAERVGSLLRSGERFESVATRYSANMRTAAAGGRLRRFSENDEDVPAALRRAAFVLPPGEYSDPIRVDEWYHIITVEQILPPDPRSPAELRPDLEQGLRDRLADPAMQMLYRTLFEQATIRVVDPVLARKFARKHPKRSAGR